MSVFMKIAVVLAGVACTGNGLRVPSSTEQAQGHRFVKSLLSSKANPPKALATLLQALSPGAAFTAALRPQLAATRRAAAPSSRSAAPQALLEVIPPSYNLAAGSIALGAAFGVPGSPLKNKITAFFPGAFCALFGLFISFQTYNLRFTFDDTSFALVKSDLSTTGENVVVGGENKWAYKSFVNYDFFPKEDFPILVYFKETQTPEDQWEVGPGKQANSPEALAKGAVRGQVHFFPAIADVSALKASFAKNGCAKL
mmetsp:Transcript_105648/g.193708  ORF Transcript_105648/g.193708 Transcript_105648/m.193708 type:complete len:256 (-) Transcript_105648:45-812(-)